MSKMMEQMRSAAGLAARKKAAYRMLQAEKFSYEEIAYYQEFSLEEVKELAKEAPGLVIV